MDIAVVGLIRGLMSHLVHAASAGFVFRLGARTALAYLNRVVAGAAMPHLLERNMRAEAQEVLALPATRSRRFHLKATRVATKMPRAESCR